MARNFLREAREHRVSNGVSFDASSQVSKGSTEVGQDEEFGEEDIWDIGLPNVEPEEDDDPPPVDTKKAASDEGLPRTFSNRQRFGFEMEKGKGTGCAPSPGWSPNSRNTSASRNIPAQVVAEPSRPVVHSSAPMNIPDWSKIYGEEKPVVNQKVEEEEDGEEVWVAPHILAQRQSMRENGGLAMSFSVYEGVGRTLKGRDQIRVRNAWLEVAGLLDAWT